MTVVIYIVCFFIASILQVFLRELLHNGSIPFIPGYLVFYLGALWVARKWSSAHKEKKEMQEIQNEIIRGHSNKPAAITDSQQQPADSINVVRQEPQTEKSNSSILESQDSQADEE